MTNETFPYDAVRRQLLACMETGNVQAAATIIRETLDVNPTMGQTLRQDVQDAYQVDLLDI